METAVALTLNRAEHKESHSTPTPRCATCSAAPPQNDVHAVVLHGAGNNFCSGGDVHEIIRPLIRLKAPGLLCSRA